MNILKFKLLFYLATFLSDDYQVIERQPTLLGWYQQLLPTVAQNATHETDRTTALLYAKALFKGANIYRRLGGKENLAMALAYHTQAYEIRTQFLPSHALSIGHSLAALGATHNELKGQENNHQAIAYYQQALTVFETHGTKAQAFTASTLYMLGNATRDFDHAQVKQAISYVGQALTIFAQLSQTVETKRETAKALFNQGLNYRILGGYENVAQAQVFLQKAANLFKAIGDKTRLKITLATLTKP